MEHQIIINSSQAKQFATVVFKDIENYIKNHQKEYDEFPKEEIKNQPGGEK